MHTPQPFASSRLSQATLALLGLSVGQVASGADFTSNPITGDFFADTSWAETGGPATGGADRVTINSGADITLSSAFSGTSSSVVTLAGGKLTVANGGSLSSPTGGTVNILNFTASSTLDIAAGGSVSGSRIALTNGSTVATININGTLTLSPSSAPYNMANGANLILNIGTGGLVQQNVGTTTVLNTQSNRRTDLNINGGRYEYTGVTDLPLGNDDLGNGRAAITISSGRFDIGGRNVTWNPAETANTFTYTGGTLANFYGVANQGMLDLVVANFGNSAAKTIDINNQRVDATARTLNLGTAGLSATLGTLQFDIYGATTADQLTGSGVFTLGTGVLIDLGYVGGPIDTQALVGQTYQLFDLENYSGLDATVSSTTWEDGIQSYTVAFTNNLAIDGTVTIASLTAIPEPSSLALLFGATSLLFATQTRRRRA